MVYSVLQQKLDNGDLIILDGGTGTELERRGVPMDSKAWCGPATLGHLRELQEVHQDYIAAGADVITTNTFASSPLMLDHAGFGDQFEDINRAAINTALRAREASGRTDVAVAGSLSHAMPVVAGTDRADYTLYRDQTDAARALKRLSSLHKEEGCDLILLEMMYHPDRMRAAFEAALSTGLPVWAGFSARRGAGGNVLSFFRDEDIPFEDIVRVLQDVDIKAAGIMHTPADVIDEALSILQTTYQGALMAYPDSGHFKMPNWQFDPDMLPEGFRGFADQWAASGVQIIGGCCGLSPEHIRAVAPLKAAPAAASAA